MWSRFIWFCYCCVWVCVGARNVNLQQQQQQQPFHEYLFTQWYTVVGASMLLSAFCVTCCRCRKPTSTDSDLVEVNNPPAQSRSHTPPAQSSTPPVVYVVNAQTPEVDGSIAVTGRPVLEDAPADEVAGGYTGKKIGALRSAAKPINEDPDLEGGLAEEKHAKSSSPVAQASRDEVASSAGSRRSGRKTSASSRGQIPKEARARADEEMPQTQNRGSQARRQSKQRVQKRPSGPLAADDSIRAVDVRRTGEPHKLSVKEQRATVKQLKINKALRNSTNVSTEQHLVVPEPLEC